MARIIFKRSDVAPAFIGDIGHPGQLNYPYEHGQGRYVGHYSNKIVFDRIQAALDAAGVDDIDVAGLAAETVDQDDCSIAAIEGASTQLGAASVEELEAIQEALAPKIVETGDFKLSFHQGVIKGLASGFKYLAGDDPVIVVTEDDGVTPYSL